MRAVARVEVWLPVAVSLLLVVVLAELWVARIPYPFDLEWMEGGMLAHAWRLAHGLPLYAPPNAEFVPFIYPPGYSALVAALAQVLPLTPALGRSVSVVAIGAAAASVGFAVRGEGGRWPVSLVAGAALLGAYPQAGAFYDLVRPDSLAIALLGWSLAIGLRPVRGAPVAAGLLLATAFLVKHNVALFGIPIALGLWVRRPAHGLQFVAASALPALAMVIGLQIRSDGAFLTYLLEVPRAHEMIWSRARIDTVRELGMALPVALAAVGLASWRLAFRQRTIGPWAAAAVPAWTGMVVGWAGTYFPPQGGALLVPTGIAYWSLTVAALAPGIWALGAAMDRRRGGGGTVPWRAVYGIGVGGTAVASAMAMRAHDGGFFNVHMPMFLVVSLAFGIVLARWQDQARGWVFAALIAQPAWSLSRLDRDRLRPTAEDAEIGWAFVDRARGIEGPILSPFGAWLPVYAGQPPSIHAMAVWDLDYPDGPYVDDLAAIRAALRGRHWVLAFGGTHHFVGPLADDYDPTEVIVTPDDDRFWPRSGFRARPWRLMVPRPGVE